jgi:integrase
MAEKERNDRRFRFTHQGLVELPSHDPESPSREMEYSDAEVVGLRFLVSKTGRRFFYFRYSVDRRKGAVRIGEFPSVSLKEARARAHEIKAQIAKGEDPRAERRERAEAPTVEEFAVNDYLPFAREHKRSWRDDEVRLHKEILPRFGKRRLADLTTREIQSMHSQLRSSMAPATANRYLSLLQRLFSLANQWGVTERNPARFVKKYKEDNARERYLSDDEVARFLRALDGLPNKAAAAGLRFLLFTGLRKNEAFRLEWRHVNRDEGTVFLAQTKSGKTRTVVLNALARGVIEEMWELREADTPWVFPGRRQGKPVVNPQKPFAAACAKAKIGGVRIHDLRHTFASLAVNSGASLYDVQKLLGHASSQMTQRYAHLADDSVRRAAEQVALRIGAGG